MPGCELWYIRLFDEFCWTVWQGDVQCKKVQTYSDMPWHSRTVQQTGSDYPKNDNRAQIMQKLSCFFWKYDNKMQIMLMMFVWKKLARLVRDNPTHLRSPSANVTTGLSQHESHPHDPPQLSTSSLTNSHVMPLTSNLLIASYPHHLHFISFQILRNPRINTRDIFYFYIRACHEPKRRSLEVKE